MAIESETSLQAAGGAAMGMAGTAADPGGSVLRLSYKGTGGDLFLLILKNLFLTLITLGIYAAWARTARRKYSWRQLDIGGQPLDYSGTGMELFAGYLKVVGGYIVLVAIPQLVLRFNPTVGLIVQVAALLVIMIIVPFAVYWSRRYLLGRTRWRGIRFSLTGEAGEFAKVWLGGVVLTVLTLGLYGPILANRIHGMIMRNTRYGNTPFSYDGSDKEAFILGIKGFFLSVITLGIYSFWYQANLLRFQMSHTHFDRATARIDVTGGFLLKLTLLNALINGVTLGIAFPWMLTYTLREMTSRMTLVGPIDYAQITQQAASGSAAADGLAAALGVEIGI